MLAPKYVTQPRNEAAYTDLFRQASSYATFQKIDVAVAYATLKGATAVQEAIGAGEAGPWSQLEKRWVVGIDWCRSEPLALEHINALENSDLRIFDGSSIVGKQGCVPAIPFHPKVFILYSDEFTAVICGSANLSRSGQTIGHEVGSLVMFDNSDVDTNPSLHEVIDWFEFVWNKSDPICGILETYRKEYEAARNLRSPMPTEDDANDLPISNRTALSGNQLRQMRACRNLWIEAGNLHANRGIGRPGNQLMLSRLTRVFFGFPATEVPRDTLIGHIRVEFAGKERNDCALRYSNNAMDVLGLPIPGTEGPESYDRETLLFERAVDRHGAKFIVRLGSARERRLWIRRSGEVSGHFKMKSGRQWGVF